MRARSLILAGVLTVTTSILVSGVSATAEAREYRRGEQWGGHGGGHGGGHWAGHGGGHWGGHRDWYGGDHHGWYGPRFHRPPVYYAPPVHAPYYAPPPVYYAPPMVGFGFSFR
jgi:hypothetical protein